MNRSEIAWAQKYRPQTIKETILPEKVKKMFASYVRKKEIPNLLLSGPPGTGKTTAAKAMMNEIGADYIMVNGSLKGGIDTLRDTIAAFASSVSMLGEGRKYVIIDESDNMSIAAQKAFRGFVEEFSTNCGFVMTCNYKNRIIEPIRESRFVVVDFVFPKDEVTQLEFQFFKCVMEILDNESIPYDKKVLAIIVKKLFPDFRKTLNVLDSYGATGKIDAGILSDVKAENIDALFKTLKEKDFDSMRQWVAENSDQDATEIYRELYDRGVDYVDESSLPGFVVTIGSYLYRNSLVADPEINLAACLTEIMYEASFK